MIDLLYAGFMARWVPDWPAAVSTHCEPPECPRGDRGLASRRV